MPKVTFTTSNVSGDWTGEHESLLEFGEAQGLDLPYGCRQGNCTACQQPVSGEVEYPNGHDGVPDEGNVLLCCSIPRTDVVIGA